MTPFGKKNRCLATNKIKAMGLDGARIQERLSWRRPEANDCFALGYKVTVKIEV
jgi:hypothetical protein